MQQRWCKQYHCTFLPIQKVTLAVTLTEWVKFIIYKIEVFQNALISENTSSL